MKPKEEIRQAVLERKPFNLSQIVGYLTKGGSYLIASTSTGNDQDSFFDNFLISPADSSEENSISLSVTPLSPLANMNWLLDILEGVNVVVPTMASASFPDSTDTTPNVSEGESIRRTVDKFGNTEWRNAKGQLHRDGDLPTTEGVNGTKWWYQNGQPHRDGDLPAFEGLNGTRWWYRNGKLHRDGGLPAREYSFGTREWWVNGERHRDGDLPAIERWNGTKYWYQNGELYRANGLPPKLSWWQAWRQPRKAGDRRG